MALADEPLAAALLTVIDVLGGSAGVVLHYHDDERYPPEWTSMTAPNTDPAHVATLAQQYGADPAGLRDVILLVPPDRVARRQQDYPHIPVVPLTVHPSELTIRDWRLLLGVSGTQAYMQELVRMLRDLGDAPDIAALRDAVAHSERAVQQQRVLRLRLAHAARVVSTDQHLRSHMRAGRRCIVDVRDPLLGPDAARGLFLTVLAIVAGSATQSNKLVVCDAAHKLVRSPQLTEQITRIVRQMRHQGVTLVLASQDPPSVPRTVIARASLVCMHRRSAPAWLTHVQRAITAFRTRKPDDLATLPVGDAYVWARDTSHARCATGPARIRMRPRRTQHGGATRQATRAVPPELV